MPMPTPLDRSLSRGSKKLTDFFPSSQPAPASTSHPHPPPQQYTFFARPKPKPKPKPKPEPPSSPNKPLQPAPVPSMPRKLPRRPPPPQAGPGAGPVRRKPTTTGTSGTARKPAASPANTVISLSSGGAPSVICLLSDSSVVDLSAPSPAPLGRGAKGRKGDVLVVDLTLSSGSSRRSTPATAPPAGPHDDDDDDDDSRGHISFSPSKPLQANTDRQSSSPLSTPPSSPNPSPGPSHRGKAQPNLPADPGRPFAWAARGEPSAPPSPAPPAPLKPASPEAEQEQEKAPRRLTRTTSHPFAWASARALASATPTLVPTTSMREGKPARRLTRTTSHPLTFAAVHALSLSSAGPSMRPIPPIPESASQRTLRQPTPHTSSQGASRPIPPARPSASARATLSPALQRRWARTKPPSASHPLFAAQARKGKPHPTPTRGSGKRKRPARPSTSDEDEREEEADSGDDDDDDDDGDMGELIVALPPPNVVPKPQSPVKPKPKPPSTTASASTSTAAHSSSSASASAFPPAQSTASALASNSLSPASTISRASPSRPPPSKRARWSEHERAGPLSGLGLPATPERGSASNLFFTPSRASPSKPLSTPQISPSKPLPTPARSTPLKPSPHTRTPTHMPTHAVADSRDEVLPSSQRAEDGLEGAFSSPAKSQEALLPTFGGGDDRGWNDPGGDWDMDMDVPQPQQQQPEPDSGSGGWPTQTHTAAHTFPSPSPSPAHAARSRMPSASTRSMRSMDEVEVSLALPVLSSSPAASAPSEEVLTPGEGGKKGAGAAGSPGRPLSKEQEQEQEQGVDALPGPAKELTREQLREQRTREIIAQIREKARLDVGREVAEEEGQGQGQGQGQLDLDLDLESDSEELEEPEDVWSKALAEGGRAKGTGSTSAHSRVEESPSSPLTTPPTSPSPPRRTRANVHLASPTPASKRPRLSGPSPPTSSTSASLQQKKDNTKSNRELARLLRQAENRERLGVTAAIQRAEELVSRSSLPESSPEHKSRKRTFSQSSGGSQEAGSAGSVGAGPAGLEHLGKDREEMVRLFERDRAERHELLLREEHGGAGSRAFWDRTAAPSSTSKTRAGKEDWSVPQWKEDELMRAVVKAVQQGDAQALTSVLYWLPMPGEGGPELELLGGWLFSVAMRHSEPAIAHTAYAHLLHLVSSRQCRLPLPTILSACRAIGVVNTALTPFTALDESTESKPLAWNRERAWTFTSIMCAFTRAHVLSGTELVDMFLLLLLVAMDPVTAPELKNDITCALEDAVKGDAVDDATCLVICKRTTILIADWTMAQKALLLSLFPRGQDKTMIMARWLAVDVLLDGAIKALDADSYRKAPSLSSLLDLIDYQSRSSPFGIHSETDYERLHLVTQIMETALTHLHSYLEERENHSKLQALAEELFTVYTKIMDSRAAHLERTEAKDALQRLSMRLRYSIPKSAPTVQAKLPFAFKAAATSAPTASTKSTVTHATQSRMPPRPRRLVA